ncbi:hypothetical protein [Streptomyces bicolor]|uniref:hypothetical protein n=1 Tax=Streptomyces bicolor TaxID=66874 RepID=UPI0004E24FA6|nr:hypothetical protein [Streptomyces bicolor]
MNLRRSVRAALPATAVALCALLTSCTSDNASSAPDPAQHSAASPTPVSAPSPSVRTLPPSRLCTAFDLTAARKVRPDLQPATQVDPNKGTAPDVCSYANADGTALLSLTPATRSYDAELSAAHSLVKDPSSAGMRDVRVTEVSGLGQAAFSERGYVVEQAQNIAFLVWRNGARVWVLTLAETGGSNGSKGTDQLVPLARQITPRLPH